MSIKTISMKCPDCGGVLSFEEDRKEGFCSYCGAKIRIHDENEFTFHTIDDAAIKRAEADHEARMRSLSIAERERTKKRRTSIAIMLLGALLACIGGVAGWLSGDKNSGLYMISMVGLLIMLYPPAFGGFRLHDDEDDIDLGDKLRVPDSVDDYESKSYTAIETLLKSAGFTNIRCVPLGDLRIGLMTKPDTVESITFDGRALSGGGHSFRKDADIIISYHSLPRR